MSSCWPPPLSQPYLNLLAYVRPVSILPRIPLWRGRIPEKTWEGQPLASGEQGQRFPILWDSLPSTVLPSSLVPRRPPPCYQIYPTSSPSTQTPASTVMAPLILGSLSLMPPNAQSWYEDYHHNLNTHLPWLPHWCHCSAPLKR